MEPRRTKRDAIKLVFKLLAENDDNLLHHEKQLALLAHIGLNIIVLLLGACLYTTFHQLSFRQISQWQLCQNFKTKTNDSTITLAERHQELKAMIDGQTSATAMQKIRMRQQISEIFKIVDTSCQINLFYTAERFAGVGLGSIATIALTITFSIAVPKGVQQSNPLVLNLGGSSLILLTTTAAMLTFLNGTSNITNSRQVHNQALAVTNKLATKLTDTKISSGGREMIEKIIHDIDNAIEPIAFFHLSIDDSVVKHSISDTPAGSATPAPPAP